MAVNSTGRNVQSVPAGYTRAGYLFFALVCLALPAIFIWQRISTPSDRARLGKGAAVFTPSGIAMEAYPGTPSWVRKGDLLVAVNGISVETLAESFFTRKADRSSIEKGEMRQYTLLRDGKQVQVEVELGAFPWKEVLKEHWGIFLFFVVSQGIASFVFLQRPADQAARALFLWAFSGSHTYMWAFGLEAGSLLDGPGFWFYRFTSTALWLFFWAPIVLLPLVFPRPLISVRLAKALLPWIYTSPFIFFAGHMGWQFIHLDSLLEWWDAWLVGEFAIGAIYLASGGILMALQYFTTRTEPERTKSRLVAVGGLVSMILGLGLYFLPQLIFDSAYVNPNGLGLINFPFIAALAIAIWRHSLFDINVIIRRTLLYSSLTAFLAFMYLSIVTLLQSLVSFQGEEQTSTVTVLSTLAIAALFSPLRRRIQDFIDRRFYRQKYDAEQALASFTTAARSETDLERLAGELSRVVGETLQPAEVQLWLCPHGKTAGE